MFVSPVSFVLLTATTLTVPADDASSVSALVGAIEHQMLADAGDPSPRVMLQFDEPFGRPVSDETKKRIADEFRQTGIEVDPRGADYKVTVEFVERNDALHVRAELKDDENQLIGTFGKLPPADVATPDPVTPPMTAPCTRAIVERCDVR